MDKTTFQVAIYTHLNLSETHLKFEDARRFIAVSILLTDAMGLFGPRDGKIAYLTIRELREVFGAEEAFDAAQESYILPTSLLARLEYLRNNLARCIKKAPKAEWDTFIQVNERNIEMMRKMPSAFPNGHYYYCEDKGIDTGDVKVYKVLGEVLPAGNLKDVYKERWVAYQLVNVPEGGDIAIYTRELQDFYNRMIPCNSYEGRVTAKMPIEITFGIKP